MPSCDVIVIGAGVNGLAAAARLARAGRKVLVLDGGDAPGGAATSRTFAPGYRVDGVAHLANMLDPRVERELQLSAHGLAWASPELATTALSATGDHLCLHGIFGERIDGELPAPDQAAWAEIRTRLLRFAGLLRPFRAAVPPRLAKGAGNDWARLAKFALSLRLMGRAEMQEFLRLLLINVADVLEDELADDRLKGLIAFDATLGAYLGPRSPNSMMLLYNRLSGQAGGRDAALALPQGGMAALSGAVARAAEAAGVEIRLGTKVGAITTMRGQVTGVELASGEVLASSTVLSAVHPVTTFLDLVGAPALETGFVRRIRAVRSRGTTGKLHLALRGLPDFRNADPRSRLVIAPSVDAVETAFNAVKYGQASENPVMECLIPSAFGPGFAPEGHHVLSANVQYLPTDIAGGWARAKKGILARIMATLEDHAPGIGKLVAHAELLSPADLEAEYGLIGGNWHHGELAVERMLFLRPVAGAAQYRTPISGLWLAGAGAHPGGGVSGAAGWNAAAEVIAEAGR